MNNSGDAAEQVVRLSLEGTEVALKLTGSAAKNIAAAIYAVLKNRDKNKIKGRQRLTAMLKSGKELKVFTISEEHLKQFATEAKRYGVVYCALRGKEKSADGMHRKSIALWRGSTLLRWIRRPSSMKSKRHGLRKVPGRKRRLPMFPKRASPKRAMRTSCWTRCWVHPQGRRSLHR